MNMAKINSSDISASLAEQMGISKSAAKAYTDFIFEEIKKSHKQKISVSTSMRWLGEKQKKNSPSTASNASLAN